MSRLLTSLLVLLLGAWPAQRSTHATTVRRRRRRPSPLGDTDAQEPIEAPDRARARAFTVHHWPGETIFCAGDRRTVVRGRWRLTLDPAHRAQVAGAAGQVSLDPHHPEVWETQLESLLTLRVQGARLQIQSVDSHGWRILEVRAPTNPETVVQLDRAALARLFECDAERMTVEFRVVDRQYS